MKKIHIKYKRLSVWILLLAQVLLILCYFCVRVDDVASNIEKISFVAPRDVEQRPPRQTYHTGRDRIFLRSVNTRSQFVDFNSSLCYLNGTDLPSMHRSKQINWQCTCLAGWHGLDCGQPEVTWRALLAHRKPLKPVLRTYQRRIVYIFPVDGFSDTLAEIRLNELAHIVDLFVLYDLGQSRYLLDSLNNRFLEQHHNKILYLAEAEVEGFARTIRNLREDDIVLATGDGVILNKYALIFLKYYNKWPEPITFRLRWSVFGYFWLHPKKTVITGGACSVMYFQQVLGGRVEALIDGRASRGLILGDLNHYGGWFCEFCLDVGKILEYLVAKPRHKVLLGKVKRIDGPFLEDIIENGVYIDGKTELLRTHKYGNNYFAPPHVLDNEWKYDFLLRNFYSKIDYYES